MSKKKKKSIWYSVFSLLYYKICALLLLSTHQLHFDTIRILFIPNSLSLPHLYPKVSLGKCVVSFLFLRIIFHLVDKTEDLNPEDSLSGSSKGLPQQCSLFYCGLVKQNYYINGYKSKMNK